MGDSIMSTVKFDTWQNTDGTENYKCRAWVNFNGTGTVAIRESGNVSSITDNGTGDYTVNFTSPMIDVNYVGVVGVATRSGPDSNCMPRYSNSMGTYPQTTSTFRIGYSDITSGFIGEDPIQAEIAFFR